jgi:hypothetical protein
MASSERTEAANATSTAAASNTTSAPAVASAPAAVAGAEGRRDGERQPSGPEAATKALKDGGPIKPREMPRADEAPIFRVAGRTDYEKLAWLVVGLLLFAFAPYVLGAIVAFVVCRKVIWHIRGCNGPSPWWP